MMAFKRSLLAALLAALSTQLTAVASSAGSAAAPPAPPPLTFAVGDKLKVSFYEAFNNDAKWAEIGKVREPGPSFYLHSEISGEFTVAADWTIAVPIIGNIVVAHHTAAEVEASLARSFAKAVGHPGFVNVAIAERTPLYIVGSVNKPGVYKFEPGMTPLNLVALAGGFKTTAADRFATVEVLRESARRISALDRLRHALAELGVLKAEIEGAPPEPPQQLVDLTGLSAAQTLIRQEQEKRKALVQIRHDRAATLEMAVEAAEHAVAIDQGRLKPMEDATTVRRGRLHAMTTLMHQGQMARLPVDDAQGALSDTQDRVQSVLAAIAEDRRRVTQAKVDARTFAADTEADLSRQLADRRRELDELTPLVMSSADVVKELAPQDTPGRAVHYSIVREGRVIAADLTTSLEPGDVIEAEVGPAPAPAPAPAPSPSPSPSLAPGADARPYQQSAR